MYNKSELYIISAVASVCTSVFRCQALLADLCVKQSHNISLLDPVENLPLHAVLQFTPPHHQMKDLVNGVFWVFLLKEQTM